MEREIGREQLIEELNRLRDGKVCIIGDIMVDRYIFGRMTRISPEAPVPVIEIDSSVGEGVRRPGGAANVAMNISRLGGNAKLLGVVGDDSEGRNVIEILKKNRVDTNGIFTDKSRPTSVKNRIIAQNQQIVRLDLEVRNPVEEDIAERIAEELHTFKDEFTYFIISDYGKGLITERLMDYVRSELSGLDKRVVVDPVVKNRDLYHGLFGITPNRREGESLSQMTPPDYAPPPSPEVVAKRLQDSLDISNVLLTLGEDGMLLLEKGSPPIRIPALAREVYDVTGAGDTVIAVFTLALSSRLSILGSALLSNIAGAVVVGKMGTSTPTLEEMEKTIANNFSEDTPYFIIDG